MRAMSMTSWLSLALACLLAACAHHSRPVVFTGTPPGISVSGTGKAGAAPDIARTSLGVEIRSASAEEAINAANSRMQSVVQALKQAGIADKDLRTHNYSIQFEQEPAPEPAPGPERAAPPAASSGTPRGFYRVSNMVEVTMRDLSAVGRVLKSATDAGANSAWGITFELENDEALVARAREEAMAKAKRAAAELARLAGVTLGNVLSVGENQQAAFAGAPMMSMRAANQAADAPIERGEVTVTYTVQLSYATTD